MNKTLATLLATTAALWGLSAQAASNAATTTATQPMTSGQAGDMKKQADAQYKAAKDKADANYEMNKAKCQTMTPHAVKSACEDDAKAEANKEKADAKVADETQKADIDAQKK
jgi:hypothetical protein